MNSIGDIITAIAGTLAAQDHTRINEGALHAALYLTRTHPRAPDCVRALRFDWDAPIPRSIQVSETLNGLRVVRGPRCIDLVSNATPTAYTAVLTKEYLAHCF